MEIQKEMAERQGHRQVALRWCAKDIPVSLDTHRPPTIVCFLWCDRTGL
jgi:hypothetical protein